MELEQALGQEEHREVKDTKLRNGHPLLPYGEAADRSLAVRKRRTNQDGVTTHQDEEREDGEGIKPRTATQRAKSRNEGQLPNGVAPRKPKGIHRIWHRRHRSIGSSPLATKVDTIKIQEPDKMPERKTSDSTRSEGSSTKAPDSEAEQGLGNFSARNSGAFGRDTDPAQIVNLALSLSESRRRNLSSGNYLSSVDPGSGRRVTSFGSQLSGAPYSPGGGSLRQHMQQQRQGSVSPLLERRKRVVSSASQRDTSGHQRGPRIISSTINNDIVDPSDATLARVEKAKESFELMYEYRRLLGHLPETLISIPQRSQGRRASKKPVINEDLLFGRDYNPLQYIRNRKLRLRERSGISAEAEGWRDVERVRAWVDQICQDHEDDVSPVDVDHPLPPWEPEASGIPISYEHATDTTPSRSAKTHKIGRPYNDWTLDPWSLLADAHWRYQGTNLSRIEGPLGQRLFENMTAPIGPSRLSQEILRQGHKAGSISESLKKPEDDDERFVRHAEKRRARMDSFAIDQLSDTTDKGRRSRWAKNLIYSREPSVSGDSDSESYRKPRPKHFTEREHLDSLALERQMMDMLDQEEEENHHQDDPDLNKSVTKLADQPLTPVDASPQSNKSPPTSPPRPRPQRLNTDLPSLNKQISPPRSSLDDHMLRHRRMSSDAVIPGIASIFNSPSKDESLPKIAIDFSPPVSPTKATPKKASSRLNPFKRTDNGREAISQHDFADPKATFHDAQLTESAKPQGIISKARSSLENANGFVFPSKPGHDDQAEDAQNSYSRTYSKESSEPESKFRHFLKPSKVVDMVGSQVSKASDVIWRKDRNRHGHPSSASTEITYPFDHNEDDDADISGLDSSPNDLSRVTTNNEANAHLSRFTSRNDRSRYHIDNLPSFRSQAEQRDPSPKSPTASPEVDPIIAQQEVQKERGRSGRFDRLAPPKIDMRSVSPSRSAYAGRSPSRTIRDDASGASDSDSRSRSRLASHDRLNDMLGIPGQTGTVTHNPTPTGLFGVAAKPSPPASKLQSDQSQWSIHDRKATLTFNTITRRDIARVRVLLLTSGVKANEIARRANNPSPEPASFLSAIGPLLTEPVPHVPSIQEHVTAARLLLPVIESTNQSIQSSADIFASTTVKSLASSLSGIETRVNQSLTPLVSECADEADAFSTELGVNHGLAYRQLSDKVDLVLRRRRRRSRWLGSGMWTMLEWVVLSTMWAVWFVVVLVRLVRGVLGAGVAVVRWLFWL